VGAGAGEPELVIVLEVALGRYVEGAVIAMLPGANAALGFFQEGRHRRLFRR
jgi:hypothetical protein